MNGIPPGVGESAPAAASAPAPNAGPSAAAFPAMPGAGAAAAPAAAPDMANMPAALQNPELAPLLQQLAASNPEMLAAIQQNPEAIMPMLMQMAQEGGMDMDGMEGLEGLDGMEGMEGMEGMDMPQVDLTPDEQSAVERICALGFDQNAALQAYLACDKNENLAANFLFEHMGDD